MSDSPDVTSINGQRRRDAQGATQLLDARPRTGPGTELAHLSPPEAVGSSRRSVRRARSRAERSARTRTLLNGVATPCDSQRREQLIAEVIEMNMGVADAIAARYSGRGLATEDLQQVAYLALIKAAHRFDAHAGHDFLSFAVPTIRGELLRYFRDSGWTVRPPRKIQEIQGRIFTVQAELSQTLGRTASVSEVAEKLAEPLADVEEALAAEGCFTPASLDRPLGIDSTTTRGDLLGSDDRPRGPVEARLVLSPLVRRLNERDKKILGMRFFDDCTQQEIAQEIGVTQTQVSRMLTRILGDLREALSQDEFTTCG